MKKSLLLLFILILLSACAKQKVVSQPLQPVVKPVPKEEVVPKEQEKPVQSVQETQIQQKEEAKKASVEEVTPTMIAKAQTTVSDSSSEEVSVLAKMIHFDFDKYDIKKEAAEILKEIADYLKANPDIRLLIEGHCDERGTREYNLQLGMRRAESAKKYLIDLGIDEKRLETISYGKDKPLVDEHNEEAWAKNRRCEFKRIK